MKSGMRLCSSNLDPPDGTAIVQDMGMVYREIKGDPLDELSARSEFSRARTGILFVFHLSRVRSMFLSLQTF